MATTEAATGMIDIQEYAERVPESAMLTKMGHLATTEGSSHYREWWGDLSAEHAKGILPVDATVAAYFSVMHPVDSRRARETDGPKNARALKNGAKVVSLHYSDGFDPQKSGVLTADVEALLGHPQPPYEPSYASVQLGLRFDNRKDVVRMFPANTLYIGDGQISDAYEMHVVEGDEHGRAVACRLGHVADSSLRSTAVMQRLGLLEGNAEFTALRDEIVASTLDVLSPDNVPNYDREGLHSSRLYRVLIEALPHLYTLDPEAGKELIRDHAKNGDLFFSSEYEAAIVEAVAAIRSPYALDSLSYIEHKIWHFKAAAEIYETRLALLGED
ncbi:MAG: hypothetical protein JWP13_971 [Candidatus Saccharibacteria bacterium]|nr:hypothetical protein [Candidatus Saccharibacteria bacterium]